MIDWLLEPFSLALQQRALVAGLLAALITAVVGTWVVIRGMTFMGDALVHGVVPGIALSVIFGFSPLIGAAVAAAAMVGGINLVHRRGAFGEDTGIGLLFVGMLALGVILLSRTGSYAGTLNSILFGDALGVTTADVVVLAVVTLVAVTVSLVGYRALLVLSFNEAKAELLGFRPALTHAVLLGLITVAVVGSFRTVGTLLAFGLLVGPPATAALLVRRVPTMMATAALIGGGCVVTGLVLSYWLETAASATIALTSIVVFFAVLLARRR
jgi:ABC-type Mn2+/Zn2+ transport system permease subunit